MAFGSLYGWHSEGYRSPDYRLPPSPEPAPFLHQVIFCAGLLGAAAGTFLYGPHLFTDEGRGHKITACPSDYSQAGGGIRVTHVNAFKELAQLAANHEIPDWSKGHWWRNEKDVATEPGELACTITVGETTMAFLLYSGHEALKARGSEAALPAGLVRVDLNQDS